MDKDTVRKKLITRFQCPACSVGKDTNCGHYNYVNTYRTCTYYTIGTYVKFNYKAFMRAFPDELQHVITDRWRVAMRFFLEGELPEWDNFTVPVWALEKDGFLFVQTVSPWIGARRLAIIEKGTLQLVPEAVNVIDIINREVH